LAGGICAAAAVYFLQEAGGAQLAQLFGNGGRLAASAGIRTDVGGKDSS